MAPKRKSFRSSLPGAKEGSQHLSGYIDRTIAVVSIQIESLLRIEADELLSKNRRQPESQAKIYSRNPALYISSF